MLPKAVVLASVVIYVLVVLLGVAFLVWFTQFSKCWAPETVTCPEPEPVTCQPCPEPEPVTCPCSQPCPEPEPVTCPYSQPTFTCPEPVTCEPPLDLGCMKQAARLHWTIWEPVNDECIPGTAIAPDEDCERAKEFLEESIMKPSSMEALAEVCRGSRTQQKKALHHLLYVFQLFIRSNSGCLHSLHCYNSTQ
uniref:Secreted protein n=1 Tax=Steinernema glaseri TaxID=37863 RepID=A0A1I7YW65_9BILA